MSRRPQLLIDGIEINNWDRELFNELRAGELDAAHATVAVWEDARATLDRLLDWQTHFRRHADLIRPVTGTSDVHDAVRTERTGVLLGFQNTAPVEDDPRLLELYHRLGVRIIQLTYNVQNAVGGSCYEPTDSGLTQFGHTLVEEMNRLGMLIDCSHVGDRTTRDAIDASASPIAITHANPRWFADSVRNKPDDVITALAERGGVLGVTLYPSFIGGPDTTLEAFAAMVVKLIDQIGVDHVAIGSDLARKWTDPDLVHLRHGRTKLNPGPASWPRWQPWFTTAADFPRLIEGLAAAGLGDDDLDKTCGGNWMRLYGQVFDAEPGLTDSGHDR